MIRWDHGAAVAWSLMKNRGAQGAKPLETRAGCLGVRKNEGLRVRSWELILLIMGVFLVSLVPFSAELVPN